MSPSRDLLRKTVFALGFVALGATLAVGAQSLAEGPGGPGCPFGGPGAGMGMGHHPGVEALMKDLDLSDAQKAKLEDIQKDLRARWEEGKDEGMVPRQLVEEILKGDAADPDLLHRLVDERIEAHRALAYVAVDDATEFAATLTPDQKALAEKHVENFGKHFRHHERGGQ